MPTLKLVLLGDNAVVHRFVQSYVAFRKEYSYLYHRIKIEIFIVPVEERPNDLAKYLALRDPWYQRHVYSAFAKGMSFAPSFNPSIVIPEVLVNAINMKRLLPVQQMHSLLQDFTRMANQEVPVCAFECRGWVSPSGASAKGLSSPKSTEAGSSNQSTGNMNASTNAAAVVDDPPDVCIPFVTSAQIGLAVDVELQRRAHTSKVPSFRDVFNDDKCWDKKKSWEPPDLVVVSYPPTLQADQRLNLGANSHGVGMMGDDGAVNRLTQDFDRDTLINARHGDDEDLGLDDELQNNDESEATEVAEGKKYTSILVTNLSSSITDEWLCEVIDDDLHGNKTHDKYLSADSVSPVNKDLKLHVREYVPKKIDAIRALKGDRGKARYKSFAEEIAREDSKLVGGVQVTSKDGSSFGVMLDGVLHGPFTRIAITPLRVSQEDSTVLKIPFMTFLPLTT